MFHRDALRLVACAGLLCLLESLAAPGFASDDQTLVLSQVSDVTGPAHVFISKQALKVVNQRDGTTIIARAPLWEVEFFNPKKKVIYETTPQKFQGQVCYSNVWMAARTTGLRAQEATPQTVAGLNANHIVFNHSSGDGSNRDEYFAVTEFIVPVQIKTILQRYFTVPTNAGIPVRYIHYAGPAKMVVLDTVDSKRTKLPSSTWDVPNGYTRAKAATEVTLTEGANDLLKDMADTLSGH